MVGLSLFSFLSGFLFKFIGPFGYALIGMFLFILWVIGFVGAIQGQEKKIPLFGDLFQDWFKGIG
jgi:uncharacterized membrane protein